jgi:hypothetical protein
LEKTTKRKEWRKKEQRGGVRRRWRGNGRKKEEVEIGEERRKGGKRGKGKGEREGKKKGKRRSVGGEGGKKMGRGIRVEAGIGV